MSDLRAFLERAGWMRSDLGRNILAALAGALFCFAVPTRTGWHLHNLWMYLPYCLTFGVALGVAELVARNRSRPSALFAYLLALMLAFLATIGRGQSLLSGGDWHYLAFTIALAGLGAIWITAILAVTRIYYKDTPRWTALFFETAPNVVLFAAVFLVRDAGDTAVRAFVRLALLITTFSAARHFLPPPSAGADFKGWRHVAKSALRAALERPNVTAVIVLLLAGGSYMVVGPPRFEETLRGAGPFGGDVRYQPENARWAPFEREMISWNMPWGFGASSFSVTLYEGGEVECVDEDFYEGPITVRGNIPPAEAEEILDHFRDQDLSQYCGSYMAEGVMDGAHTVMEWCLNGRAGTISSFNAAVKPMGEAYERLNAIRLRLFREQNRETAEERRIRRQREYEQQRR